MRSSKSRSRSKSNRNRSVGNVVNRVFDSSGPEGKVRGTPQQIIDKYNQLARDAQLSGDRVATENFQQHAEHYMRLLSEAQREQEARREEQERQNRERQAQRDRERAERQERESAQSSPAPAAEDPFSAPDPGDSPQPDIVDVGADDDSGLVETPENTSAKPKARAPRRRPAKKAAPEEAAAKENREKAAPAPADDPEPGSQEAAE